MAERTDTEQGKRRLPDFLTMFMGLVTLFVSSFVLTDGTVWWPQVDLRWLIAGAALLVGLLLLASSLRGGRRRR